LKKYWGLIALVLTATPANATPPNVVCEVSETPINIEINLSTNYSNLNGFGVIPRSVIYSAIKIDPQIDKISLTDIPLYSEDIVGQWLLNKRIDLQFYKEEKQDNGEILSISLIINTTSTGKTNEDSGQTIHQGTYDLQFFSGSKRENTGKLIKQFGGKAICG